MSKILYCILICYFSGICTQKILAQEEGQYEMDFGGLIYLDSIVVKASKAGFDVGDFITMVREDESFYRAFRNLRFAQYVSDFDIKMLDKKAKEKARYKSKIKQHVEDDCRTMDILYEEVDGNFYKRKKKYRYYTAKMFDQLFYTHGRVCETREAPLEEGDSKGIRKHIVELKKLIFSPGSKADVPLIGKKTAIFSKEMAPYYDYKIESKKYKNTTDCYVFKATVKPEFLAKKNETVIKNLETYFNKENFQIVARNYNLQYASMVYDFDVAMKIELLKKGEEYLPQFIYYNGNWDVPMKKREIAEFSISFYDFD